MGEVSEFDFLGAEGWIAMESSSHLPEKDGFGCICGFCAWSPEHVAVMAYRGGIRAALAHHRATTHPTASAGLAGTEGERDE